MNYKMMSGPDSTTWITLEPLMQDVNHNLEKLNGINIEGLSQIDKDIMQFNILGMKAVSTFLGALLQEHKGNQHEKTH